MNSVDTLLDKINAAIRPLVEEAIAAERANIGVAFAEFLTSGEVWRLNVKHWQKRRLTPRRNIKSRRCGRPAPAPAVSNRSFWT